MASQLLFVIGTSGVGKTAAVEALRARPIVGLACHHFDSISVPTVVEMTRQFASPEHWQEIATQEWAGRLGQCSDPVVILEGQTRPSFIRSALAGKRAGIVLLDCHPTVRSQRLRTGRRQPELDTPEMQQWAVYLRGQAEALGLPIIDTTSLTPDEVADQLFALAQTVSTWATP